ncbi:MAG: phosphomethylpyrimidine kinase [Peptococcaceae bacterium BICA1-8]|nr:MAG: phosphomethylpyrimidine kinase [Peptococcaceae bacterium BICA1-8]
MNKILTIAGSDSGGGAGIQADIKTITVLGEYACSVLTSITAQNTLGVQGVFILPGEFIAKQLDSVLSDIEINAAKTGMLANSEIIKVVSSKIKEFNIEKLVVDPVMVATSGDILLEVEAISSLKESLLPLAYIVTPNLSEAEVLSGLKINSISDMKTAAKIIFEYGPKNVLIKGGHLMEAAVDVLYNGTNFEEFSAHRIETKNTHGTGCTLSAAIATFLGKNISIEKSVWEAKNYLTQALQSGKDLRIGKGSGPVNHLVEKEY